MTDDFEFSAEDEVLIATTDPLGYRIVLDLSDDDARLIDEIARRDGLQPTQALIVALREYAAARSGPKANAQAFRKLSVALRRGTVSSATAPQRRVA